MRTAIGPYALEEAVDPDDGEALGIHAGASLERLARLDGMGRMVVDTKSTRGLSHGNLFGRRAIVSADLGDSDTHALVFSERGELLAVVAIDGEGIPSGIIALPCMRNS